MSEESESYMRGWQSGYHNATLAERNRILKMLEQSDSVCSFWAIELIKGEEK